MTETMIIAEAEVEAAEEVEEDFVKLLPDDMNSSGKSTKNKNCVRFGTVTVRNYGMTLGTNPATSIGSPVCLEWDYEQLQTILIDVYETTKNFGRIVQIQNKNRSPREFYLNYYKRRGILERAGFTEHDFTSMERQIKYERLQRKITLYQSFPILYLKSWKIASAQRKSKNFVRKYRKEHHGKPTEKIKVNK